jgi:hypothetical protein
MNSLKKLFDARMYARFPDGFVRRLDHGPRERLMVSKVIMENGIGHDAVRAELYETKRIV